MRLGGRGAVPVVVRVGAERPEAAVGSTRGICHLSPAHARVRSVAGVDREPSLTWYVVFAYFPLSTRIFTCGTTMKDPLAPRRAIRWLRFWTAVVAGRARRILPTRAIVTPAIEDVAAGGPVPESLFYFCLFLIKIIC